MSTQKSLVAELDELHASYVAAVNAAIQADDLATAHDLAEKYDEEAIHLIAVRENKTHLLPLKRRGRPDSRLRRMVLALGLPKAS